MIFGCSNPAGNAFAYYLAEKGFNLILIARSNQSLNDLESGINDYTKKAITIEKVEINKFDENSIY